MTNRDRALQLLIEERDGLSRAIDALQGVVTGQKRRPPMDSDVPQVTNWATPDAPKKRRSEAARRRMAAAQKLRWAKAKSEARAADPAKHLAPTPDKRTISAAGRKRIAAAQKARWAKTRAAAKKGKATKTMSAGGSV